MKHYDETESRLLRACWLSERELRDLLVKQVAWRNDRLYVILKDREIEPFLDLPPGRDQLKGHEQFIWMVGERWVPVIAGQEHVLLELTTGCDPDGHVFSQVHLPSRRKQFMLQREYARALYTMFSGHPSPEDNTRLRPDKRQYEDIDTQRYDADAVADVAHVLGLAWTSPGWFALTYIGHRSPRPKKRKETVSR